MYNEFSNIFDKIGKEWMLVGATKDGESNVMTASWGGMGVMWNKKVAFVFVRPQRYTREFIDNSEYLTLSFFDEKYRKMLTYMGTVSGRDEDKIAISKLDNVGDEKGPCFTQAKCTLTCKKLYRQDMEEQCFLDKKIIDQFFKLKDYHIMYVVEIISIK